MTKSQLKQLIKEAVKEIESQSTNLPPAPFDLAKKVIIKRLEEALRIAKISNTYYDVGTIDNITIGRDGITLSLINDKEVLR